MKISNFVNKALYSGGSADDHVSKFRDQGDLLRDAGNFAEAAEAYDKYLTVKPDDFGIWVQRGNCLKDSGSFAAAKMAYEQAIRLNPNDADVHLQLGHALKLQGKIDEAIKAYKKSAEINPMSIDATSELRGLGVRTKQQASPLKSLQFKDRPASLLDISDLLVFLADNTRVTGIQRVQSCIVQEILNDKHEGLTFAADDVVFCFCEQGEQAFYGISAVQVSELLSVLNSNSANRSSISNALRGVYASKIKIEARRGDIYIILGAFWIGANYSGSLLQLKSNGAKFGVYIYDLIPITHPQFVTESTRRAVIDNFADVMSLADFALTISDYVAKEVTYVLESELNRKIPVLAVPLSHALPDSAGEYGLDVDEVFVTAIPKEFVLCVCTLEGRKNHILLLHAWASLNRKYNGNIPTLVLVGKWGWKIEEFQSQLSATNNVAGKILVLGNLPDDQLKYLYQNCLFTVFPSFVEGWGLPVGESLAHGKPCIASNTSSIPEVGGEFCRYINPYDPMGAVETIERAIVDREGLERWTAHVARDFKMRSWSDVAHDFLEKLSAATSAIAPTTTPAITLEPGRVYSLTKEAIGASWKARATKFVCAFGWRPFEDWGAWSSRHNAEIAFATGLAAGSKVRVLLNLRLPPSTGRGSIVCKDAFENSTTAFFPNGRSRWQPIDCQTDDSGQIRIRVDRIGSVEHLDHQHLLFCGISGVAYHARDDIAARIDILESIVLSR